MMSDLTGETQAHHTSTSCLLDVSQPASQPAIMLERERHFKVCALNKQTQQNVLRMRIHPGEATLMMNKRETEL